MKFLKLIAAIVSTTKSLHVTVYEVNKNQTNATASHVQSIIKGDTSLPIVIFGGMGS